MRTILILLFTLSLGCTTKPLDKTGKMTVITRWEQVEQHENQLVIVEGFFEPYQPNEKGKGSGHMYWDWQIRLEDDLAIPAQADPPNLNLDGYNGDFVQVKAFLFFGTVIGIDDGISQSARGWRFDIHEIQKIKKRK